MSWEQIEKKSGRGAFLRPKEWKMYPCVVINKTAIGFNKLFSEAYSPHGKMRGIYILVNRERRALGFKIPSEDQIENDNGWYSVSDAKGRKNNSTTTYTGTTKRIADAFPDCVGRIYRAHLNPENRIIEVVLSPDNQVGQ